MEQYTQDPQNPKQVLTTVVTPINVANLESNKLYFISQIDFYTKQLNDVQTQLDTIYAQVPEVKLSIKAETV